MSKKNINVLFFLLFLFLNKNSFTAIKGSETAVSVQPAFTFLAADSDNTMLGFGWFKNGFSLEDNTTTCTFDSVYPISGDIDLNGGTLYLAQDLILKNITSFLGLGKIIGNNYLLEFCSSIKQLPSDQLELQDVVLYLHNDLVLTDTIIFKGECEIFGDSYDIDLDTNGCIIIDSNAHVTFSDINIHGVRSDSFIMTDDTSQIVLENVSWLQHEHYNFTHGSMLILNDVDFIGSYTFFYDSSQTSTISHFSKWGIIEGMCLKIGRKDAIDGIEPLCFEDETSVLSLDNCSLVVTDSGMSLKSGKLEFNRDVNLDILGTTISTGLVMGTGQPGYDNIFQFNSGSTLIFRSGQIVYNNYRNDRILVLSKGARILRYGPSKMHIEKDCIYPAMNFEIVSGQPETTLADGVAFYFDGVTFSFEDFEYDFKGHQCDSTGGFLLDGDSCINFKRGTFFYPLSVSGSNNKIYGSGNINTSMVLEDSDSTLTFDLNGLVTNDIVLNGGTIELDGDLNLGLEAIFLGTGTVDLSNFNFELSGFDSLWTSTIGFKSSSGVITLHSNVEISGQWIFQDSCVINGNGHTIDMGDTGIISIKDGVQLTLKNVIFHTVSQDDIHLETDNSSIVLDSITWLQDTDIVFDTGSMLFLNDIDFRGLHSFTYESSRTSTISANSKWKISKGMSLEIGRKESEDSAEPLYFEDDTSVIRFDDCSLIITGSGIQFTKGKIEVERYVDLSVMGTTTTNGMMLGDGTADGDMKVKVFPGAALNFLTGQMVYNNYENNLVQALSETAIFIRYGDSKVYAARDWTFPNMSLKVASGQPETSFADGVSMAYDNTDMIFSTVNFDFKGRQIYQSVFALEGSDFLYLSKGNFMLPLVISGTNNQVHGTGTVSGGITLQDSDADVSFDLNGTIWNTVSLNGGIATLMGDLHLGGDYAIEGPGQVRLMRYNVILGGQDSVWASNINWHSNGVELCPYNYPRGIDLNAKTTLSGKWNIQDCCTINGHGQMLDLGDTGQIQVQDGVCLTLRDVILHSSGENNIYCTSDTSSITFDNVTWIQDSNVTFTKGSMEFVNEVDFISSHSFVYDSSQTSTIKGDSYWRIAGGMILRMGRQEHEGSLEPICFENETSIFKFDNCNWVVTGSGVTITTGELNISGDVVFDIVGTTTSDGFTLGTGLENEDAVFIFNAGATLHFRTGKFIYNNYAPDGFVALSENATVIRYGSSSAYVNHDWTLPYFVVKTALGFSETTIVDGVSLRYDGTHLAFSDSHFEYVGAQSKFGYFLMEGDDYIFIDKGAFIFPIAVTGIGNKIYGAGGFNGLIMIQDANTELHFGLNGTLGENILMNGGKLILADDLYLTGGTTLVGSGKIDLDGYKLAFGGQDIVWDSPYFWEGEDSSCIDIRSKFDLRSTWTLSGEFTLNGYGNILDLSNGGDIVIDNDSKVTFRNVKITGVSGSNIKCLDDDSIITLDNATWVQDGNYTFTKGRIEFINDVDFIGSYSFVYDTSQTSTIKDSSCWRVAGGMILRVGKQENEGSLEPLYFENESSVFKLDNCNLIITGSGMTATRGEINIDGDVVFDITGTTTLNGFTLGTGVEGDDATFIFNSRATLHFKTGKFCYNNFTPDGFVALSENATVLRYGTSSACVKHDWTLPYFTIKTVLGFSETTIINGAKLRYDSTHLSFSDSHFEYKGSQSIYGYFSMEGDDYVFIDKGAFVFPIAITGTGNKIYGAGGFNGLVMMQDSDAELTFAFNGTLGENVLVNGGKIILGDDLYLTGGTKLIGSGKIDLDGYKLALGGQDLIWDSSYFWEGESSSCIDIRSKVDLRSTWTLSGEFTLNGYGNILDLSNGGNIVVDDASSVIFRNVKITGVSDNNIRCLGDDSVIILDDTTWVQDGNYTFTKGAIKVKNEVKLEGPYDFAYNTKMTSTILQDSMWRFGVGSTLEYDPQEIASKDLIEFYDNTSYLKFCSASLHTTVTGINLKKGTVIVKGECGFSSDGYQVDDETIINEGITFGSGAQEDDCVLQVSIGSVFNFVSGAFIYNNVLASSLIMDGRVSSIKVLFDTEFMVNQDLNLGLGSFYISGSSLLSVAEGKNIIGSMFITE